MLGAGAGGNVCQAMGRPWYGRFSPLAELEQFSLWTVTIHATFKYAELNFTVIRITMYVLIKRSS